MSKIKIRPDEALKLQQEIEHYLRWRIISESMFDQESTKFERRILKALSERDANFFEMMAAFCKTGTNQWRDWQSHEQEVLWIAVQARMWLEFNKKPVTRDAIRSLTKTIWAARLNGYKPDGVFEITRQKTVEFCVAGKGDAPITFEIEQHRSPVRWSELDYITALHSELEVHQNSDLRAKIDQAALGFPKKDVWKRVWKDPRLSDIKPMLGRPPRE